MMSGVNKVIILGNLGADPDLRYTTSGVPVSNLRIATTEFFQNRDGQRDKRTEWHRVVAFGRLAETCKKYLKKGRQVYLEGRLRTREWDNPQGEKRYTTEIVMTNMVLLGARAEPEAATEEVQPSPEGEGIDIPPEPAETAGEDNSDMPF